MTNQNHEAGKTTSSQPSPTPSGQINDRAIAERISLLLAHYWTPDMDLSLRRELARDWVEDLREFPASIVAEACAEWRRGQTRKPTIADIRSICKEMKPLRLASAAPQITDEQPAERNRRVHDYEDQRKRQWREAAIARDQWAQELGWVDYRDWMAAGFDGRRHGERGKGPGFRMAPTIEVQAKEIE